MFLLFCLPRKILLFVVSITKTPQPFVPFFIGKRQKGMNLSEFVLPLNSPHWSHCSGEGKNYRSCQLIVQWRIELFKDGNRHKIRCTEGGKIWDKFIFRQTQFIFRSKMVKNGYPRQDRKKRKKPCYVEIFTSLKKPLKSWRVVT